MSNAMSTIVGEICDRRMEIFFVFTVSTFFMLLQAVYLLFIDPDPAVYVISVVNLVGLGVSATVSGVALWYCKSNY